MNKYIETADFAQDKFPLDCGTLSSMQDNSALMAILARIAVGSGKDKLVLLGCEENGAGYRSEGYVWMSTGSNPGAGEILYHPEQLADGNCQVEEETESPVIDNVTYTDLYRHRQIKDTSLGNLKWTDFARVDDMCNADLKAATDKLEAGKQDKMEYHEEDMIHKGMLGSTLEGCHITSCYAVCVQEDIPVRIFTHAVQMGQELVMYGHGLDLEPAIMTVQAMQPVSAAAYPWGFKCLRFSWLCPAGEEYAFLNNTDQA